ncbi:MAG TPA: iron-sulfur cluster repair di-iron protein [Pyrinomonadaceae bacterium]|nr:iron-sulfur cluster repair di-iron protein [Pyrinomonadaceae bacterium]
MMNNLTTKTVREIALEMPLTTRVFEDHKIDFCCGGNRLFLEACKTAGADAESVLKEISVYLESPVETELDWVKTADLSKLIGYIVEKHHVYTRDEIKNLMPLMVKVAGKHGEHHTELYELERLFGVLCSDLAPHLLKEEQVLFPYIKELENFKIKNGKVPVSCFGTVKNPVGMMLREHDTAGEILRSMREVSHDYRVPEGACPSYAALLTRLEAFEKDLHQHIHLENNVLFPKAVELENEIFSLEL